MPWSSGCPESPVNSNCRHGNGTDGDTMKSDGTFVKNGTSATIYKCSVCDCRYSTHSDFGE